MPDTEEFPFPVPARVPITIDPCPIVEAAFELRFAGTHQWTTMPGLLYAQIRERYREQRILPLSQVPDEVRTQEPFVNQPLVQFLSDDFIVQLGPRVVNLVTKPNEYPGWQRVVEQLTWLLTRFEQAGIMGEGERLGVRYVDFFSGDIFANLVLDIRAGAHPLHDGERQLTSVFKHREMALRLLVANSAIVASPTGEPRSGSILDVDAWFSALDFDLFTTSMERFHEAHDAIKRLFFGLLRPEFLATLNPRY